MKSGAEKCKELLVLSMSFKCESVKAVSFFFVCVCVCVIVAYSISHFLFRFLFLIEAANPHNCNKAKKKKLVFFFLVLIQCIKYTYIYIYIYIYKGLHNFLEKKKKREQCSLKKSTASVKARLSFSPSTCTVKLTKEKKKDVFFVVVSQLLLFPV